MEVISRPVVSAIGFICLAILAACGRQDPVAPAAVQTAAAQTKYASSLASLSEADALLFNAVCAGNVAQIDKALASGGNVNAVDQLHRTPLFAGAFCNQPEAIKLLLEKGADASKTDMGGMTVLHAATVVGGVEALEALIGGGAHVNARDGSGRTPLHLAAATNQLRVADLLLRDGADATIRDAGGKSAAVLASSNGHKELAVHLRKKAKHDGNASS